MIAHSLHITCPAGQGWRSLIFMGIVCSIIRLNVLPGSHSGRQLRRGRRGRRGLLPNKPAYHRRRSGGGCCRRVLLPQIL